MHFVFDLKEIRSRLKDRDQSVTNGRVCVHMKCDELHFKPEIHRVVCFRKRKCTISLTVVRSSSISNWKIVKEPFASYSVALLPKEEGIETLRELVKNYLWRVRTGLLNFAH